MTRTHRASTRPYHQVPLQFIKKYCKSIHVAYYKKTNNK